MEEPQWGRAGRKFRRETSRALAKEIMGTPNRGRSSNSTSDLALWFLAAFMALGLLLVAPKIGRGLTVAVVAAMGLCLVHPLWQLPWVQNASFANKSWRFGGTLVIALAVLTLFAIYVWPPIRRHILTDVERERFEEPLKQQTDERYTIQLTCPSADESICVYAAQFINLFREAGWKVQNNQVQRVVLGVPYEGIRIFAYVEKYPEPDAPVGSGVWTKVSTSLISVYRSFHAISIEPEEGIRNDMKENVLTIYFGSERADESKPTDLTKMYGRLPEVKRQYPNTKLP